MKQRSTIGIHGRHGKEKHYCRLVVAHTSLIVRKKIDVHECCMIVSEDTVIQVECVVWGDILSFLLSLQSFRVFVDNDLFPFTLRTTL